VHWHGGGGNDNVSQYFGLGKTAEINTLSMPKRWPVGLIARERRVTPSTHPKLTRSSYTPTPTNSDAGPLGG